MAVYSMMKTKIIGIGWPRLDESIAFCVELDIAYPEIDCRIHAHAQAEISSGLKICNCMIFAFSGRDDLISDSYTAIRSATTGGIRRLLSQKSVAVGFSIKKSR